MSAQSFVTTMCALLENRWHSSISGQTHPASPVRQDMVEPRSRSSVNEKSDDAKINVFSACFHIRQ